MSVIKDCESDQTARVFNPKLTASVRAVLIAIAFAMKTEPTKQRFDEVWWRMLLFERS